MQILFKPIERMLIKCKGKCSSHRNNNLYKKKIQQIAQTKLKPKC